MAVNVRPAEESDVPVLLELIMQLAIYENEPDQVKVAMLASRCYAHRLPTPMSPTRSLCLSFCCRSRLQGCFIVSSGVLQANTFDCYE